MIAESENNFVQLLLDGDEFFDAFHTQLTAVQNAAPANNTYVRLAYWWASPTFTVDGNNGAVTLPQALYNVANAGHKVDVILWNPNKVDKKFDPTGMTIDNYNDHSSLKNLCTTTTGANYHANISVYLETYDGWWGASTHQKIAIFSIAGRLTVLVGGLNLANDYYADIPHDVETWHDTGIQINGPAACDVEGEWIRRWNKGFTQLKYLESQVPVLGGVLKSVFNTVYSPVCAQRNQQLVALVRPLTDVTVATTNAEGYLYRETNIQAKLLQEIGRANNYIYLENFTLSDPSVVRAIHDRLQAVPTLKVIVMLPENPSYLDRMSFLKIAMQSITDFTYTTNAGNVTVTRANCDIWSLSESYNFSNTARSYTSTFKNPWMANDGIKYRLTVGDRTEKLAKFVNITAINGGLRFYKVNNAAGQNIYIHSKLVLIDDRVALIGSANFNFRSMVYDGELSCFIYDRTVGQVRNIRSRLFAHYDIDFDANWNIQNLNTPNTTTVLPIPLNEYNTDHGEAPNFTWE